MDAKYRENSGKYWEDVHQSYDSTKIKVDDWLERFDDIIMASTRPIMDLGCGGGNDTKYLMEKGKQVIACDGSRNAIANLKANFPDIKEARCMDMLDGFDFEDESFEVIIADLCLHYFDEKDTEMIISELKRILVPGGHIILRVNSINDVNHGAGQGKEIEYHVYESSQGTMKRFFDEADIRKFFKEFEIEYLKEEIMSRYRLEKKLYRVCVRK